MAFEIRGQTITLPAGQDLSAGQYLLVQLAGDGKIDVVSGTTGLEYIGVLQNNPDAVDIAATVQVDGISKMVCGATVTVGDIVVQGTTTAGRIETLAGGADQNIVGRALQTGAVGEIIAVLMTRALTHA